MGRVLLSVALWALVATGALAAVFFSLMLLTPGYGDVVIGVAAALSVLVVAGAWAGLRRLGRDRREHVAAEVTEVLSGRLLEQVAPSRRRWSIMAFAAGVLLACSLVMLLDGLTPALLLVALLLGLFVLSLVPLLPGVLHLRVTTRGLVVRHLGRTRAHRWEDVDGFRVYEVRSQYVRLRLVGWKVADGASARRRAARWVRWPTGLDDGLPTEYEGDPEELAARLQRHRDTYADSCTRDGDRVQPGR